MRMFRDIIVPRFIRYLFLGYGAKTLDYRDFVKSLILVGLFIFLSVTPAHAVDMTITKYHADINIYETSQMEVKEAIDVQFHRQRHGIYRDIPYIYKDDLGGRVKTPFEVIDVLNEKGKSWKYKTIREGGNIRIRIGDPDKYVTGKNTYIIHYRVDNVILFFPDHDELYWNIVGNGWDADIKDISATVTLSSKKETKEKWASCYTGPFGSKEMKCGYKPSGNTIHFTSRDLMPYEGFTIAYGWDKGIIKEPGKYQRLLWKIKENWMFSLPLISLILMFYLWYSGGRDPKVREVLAVQYEPPKFREQPLNAAEVGALIDEKLHMRDITASIVGLAVKGFIKMDETKKKGIIFDSTDYSLTKVKGPDSSLSEFENKLMGDLFGSGKIVSISSLKNKFFKNIPELKKTIYKDLRSKGYFKNNPDDVKIGYMIAGFILLGFGTIIGGAMADSIGPSAILAGILTGIPVLAFSRFMPSKTVDGARALADIKGFEEFLTRAEKDRLERMKDENLFSKYLPYAMALNVEEDWAEAFEGIYQKPPEWYSSPGGFKRFSTSSFTSGLGSAMSSIGSAMATAPRSSGGGFSSGGGSSGGGSGGGGGGSW